MESEIRAADRRGALDVMPRTARVVARCVAVALPLIVLLPLTDLSCRRDTAPSNAEDPHTDPASDRRSARDARRNRILAAVPGADELARRIADCQRRIAADEHPIAELERLGQLFVVHARRAHDETYYAMARACADWLGELQPGHPGALLLRGHALHSMHAFREAEAVARELVAARGNGTDHGLLGDVLLDLGRPEEAEPHYRAMLAERPGLESYARAARLRWLGGDLEGATLLMERAVGAGSPRTATATAWAEAWLARYRLQAHALDDARHHADAALALQPNCAEALFVRGSVLLLQGDTARAADDALAAAEATRLPEHRWFAADTLRRADRDDEAHAQERLLEAEGWRTDPRHAALWLATRHPDRASDALQLAELEFASRQDVHTQDLVGYCHLRLGDLEAAAGWLTKAQRHGTPEPRFALHAAELAEAHGRSAEAARLAATAWPARGVLMPSERDRLTALRARD